jgi:GNAT superfamily N-acetyltransferase
MPDWPLALRRAGVQDMPRVLALIEDAARWLRESKNTDQWAKPWPTRLGRDSRVLASLRAGRTWICWDRATPAATITADPNHDPYWAPGPNADPAIYVHRLVVARSYAGNRLGARLLDWAGRTGRLVHDAHWLRISAWTTNLELHRYYIGEGFRLTGFHPDDGYPSAARFEKPTELIGVSWQGLFTAPADFNTM